MPALASIAEYLPDCCRESLRVGHEAGMITRKFDRSCFQLLCQRLGSPPRNLTSRGGTERDDDPRLARAEGLDRWLIAGERLQHAEEEQLIIRALLVRGLWRRTCVGDLSFRAGWRPGDGWQPFLSHQSVMNDEGDELAPRRAGTVLALGILNVVDDGADGLRVR